jgi:hypothetical protein
MAGARFTPPWSFIAAAAASLEAGGPCCRQQTDLLPAALVLDVDRGTCVAALPPSLQLFDGEPYLGNRCSDTAIIVFELHLDCPANVAKSVKPK